MENFVEVSDRLRPIWSQWEQIQLEPLGRDPIGALRSGSWKTLSKCQTDLHPFEVNRKGPNWSP
jgi:hypothetical protein